MREVVCHLHVMTACRKQQRHWQLLDVHTYQIASTLSCRLVSMRKSLGTATKLEASSLGISYYHTQVGGF